MQFADLNFKTHPTFSAGVQATHTFPNGYGVSVVKTPYSYGGSNGLYELAVIGQDGSLTYDTPVTSDVEGHLTEANVTAFMQQVETLPAS